MFQYLLELSLLITSILPGFIENPANANIGYLENNFERFAWAYRAFFVSTELIDHRETRYMLQRKSDFVSDLQMIAGRAENLRGVPLTRDFCVLPHLSREDVNHLKVFNRSFAKFLDERKTMVYDDRLEPIIKENQRLFMIYDLIWDTKCEYYNTTVRREAIKNLLKELDGKPIPHHVPLQYFQKVQ